MSTERTIKGIVICPGIGIGPAYLAEHDIALAEQTVEQDDVSTQQNRYTDAVEKVGVQLRFHIDQLVDEPFRDAAEILRVHHAMLSDDEFHGRVLRRIVTDLVTAETAVVREGEEIMRQFEATSNPYFQARAEDVRDLVEQIVAALVDKMIESAAYQPEAYVHQLVVSKYLRPSSVMWSYRSHAAGFATESNALTSHAAILLKGFAIPSVGSLEGLEECIQEGDTIIVDGMKGKVVVRPSAVTLSKYRDLKESLEKEAVASIISLEPCATRDGTRVHLCANIENPEQLNLVTLHGLEGIGLFRTEFLMLQHGGIPSEDTQFEVYKAVVEAAEGKQVVLRTFDIGGDKDYSELTGTACRNPSLGRRGIRRHINDFTNEFHEQLRAILRTAAVGPISIMYPMVTTVNDVIEANRHLAEVRKELASENLPFLDQLLVGAMIEVPAAAVGVRRILEKVDFISIGTNDLLQYFMAADRDNEEVLEYNDPENEDFLWLMKHIIDEAGALGRHYDVTICGEIAARPALTVKLIELGFRSFSVSPIAAARVREAIRAVSLPG